MWSVAGKRGCAPHTTCSRSESTQLTCTRTSHQHLPPSPPTPTPQAGVDHAVLEKHAVGATWQRERWDSFRLVTENQLCALPGFPCTEVGADPPSHAFSPRLTPSLPVSRLLSPSHAVSRRLTPSHAVSRVPSGGRGPARLHAARADRSLPREGELGWLRNLTSLPLLCSSHSCSPLRGCITLTPPLPIMMQRGSLPTSTPCRCGVAAA